MEKLYNAKKIVIGKIYDSNFEDYYLDIIEENGNQQTIATGSYAYVIDYIKYVLIQ